MKAVIGVLFACTLAACSSTKVTSVGPSTAGTVSPSARVDVLLSPPDREYDVIGVVSATRYKPGWTDPSVADAIPQLQEAGRRVGADAVIVRSSRSNNDRHVVIEAEAIRYRD